MVWPLFGSRLNKVINGTQQLKNKWEIDSESKQNKQVVSFTDLLSAIPKIVYLVSRLLFVRSQRKTCTQGGT